MSQTPIKILLVEDSPVAMAILQKVLQSSPEIKIVGTACNGKEALNLIPQLDPHVICTDFHMAQMDGLELTRQVMAKYPRPILVISNSVQANDPETIFKLMQAGAIEIFPKPITGLPSDYDRIRESLITKIKVLAGVKVFTKPLSKIVPSKAETVPTLSTKISVPKSFKVTAPIKIVTIGASTGGPQALQKVLSPLPKDFPVPIICTQHISEGFLPGFVDWLASECHLKVTIATEGELPLPGTIYFAPDGRHLELNSLGKFIHKTLGTVDGHCPSVTVMFQSVAKFYGNTTLGILLTGMGKDGAAGMKTIEQAGGITIAQDEASSVVFGMPKEAIALGGAQYILPVKEIAPSLLKIFNLSF
ncbi:MAG: chemotaxis-specific protein-glutamate methyltransferase CheB [Hydrococcus sp. RU_2_2]|nr:chemotaxis-specific protein-glutamate methyltransferase CheB [Hydrococcus sp. RU_2_2]NJP20157.1 chemotaxis-specific protein-glutamate methyltransferase CheB [Hydrococcus sp. CRU_1_1]